MTLSMTLNGLSALFAVAAAVLWFCSAKVSTPEKFAIHVTEFGGSYGFGYSPELIVLAGALVKQSKLSAHAATCAAVAACVQGLEWIRGAISPCLHY